MRGVEAGERLSVLPPRGVQLLHGGTRLLQLKFHRSRHQTSEFPTTSEFPAELPIHGKALVVRLSGRQRIQPTRLLPVFEPHPRPATHTLHPSPYTLHPTPYTLHPTPCEASAAAREPRSDVRDTLCEFRAGWRSSAVRSPSTHSTYQLFCTGLDILR